MCLPAMQYRTTKNYQSGAFLGPRIGDKILISLLLMTLYLNIGRGRMEGRLWPETLNPKTLGQLLLKPFNSCLELMRDD